MLVSGLAARMLFEQYGLIRSGENWRTTDDGVAGHCCGVLIFSLFRLLNMRDFQAQT